MENYDLCGYVEIHVERKGTSALRTAELAVGSVKKAIPTRRTQGIPGSRLQKSH